MQLLIVPCLLGVVAFASTNVDGLFVLVGFFADRRFSARDVVLGQYLGTGILYFASVLASLISLIVERRYVGLLGLAPIAIGTKQLLIPLRARNRSEAAARHQRHTDGTGRSITVAAATLTCGGDNLGTYIPLFATQDGWTIAGIGAVFLLLTAVWCVGAHWLVYHPTLGAPLRRYGHLITPMVLIGLGLLILVRNGSFTLIS